MKKILSISSFKDAVYLYVEYKDGSDEKLGQYDIKNTPYEHDLSNREVKKIIINSKEFLPIQLGIPHPTNPSRTLISYINCNLAKVLAVPEEIVSGADLSQIVAINVVAVEMREDSFL